MNRLFQAMAIAMCLSVGIHSTAVAEDVPQADRVVLVDFDTHDVEAQVMEQFYANLQSIIEDTESLGLEEHGDFSMDDLWLMAGCSDTSAECLGFLSDFVDGDQLLFGAVGYSDGTLSFSMTLFDFEAGENISEISGKTLSGDDAWLAEGIPAVIEHFLFGETASLTVHAASDAEVLLDGEVVGSGTANIEGVAPGEATVTVKSDDETQEERVILRHEENLELTFDDEPSIADIDDPDYSTPSLYPGLAAVGVGVLGLGVGVVGQTQLSSARNEAEDRVANGVFDGDPARAHELQSDMDSANTLRFIGFTGGVVGLAAGGALLFRALTAEPAGDDLAGSPSFDLDVGASSDGVNAGFRIDF